jgi:endonuclease/exonuclease/phosphatase family metal-dependent hydrolase
LRFNNANMEGVQEMTIGRKIWLCMMWLLAAMVVSTSAGAQPAQGQVTIMTQNMNVGNFGTLREGMYSPEAVTKFFIDTRDNLKPKDRAAAIATEIQANKPDLVALQEVGLLRKGVATGPTANNPNIPATEVVHDQLQLLRDALARLNPPERYDTVAIIPNSDMQFPSTPDLGHVVRVTDRTVILARSNRLKLSNVQVQEFLAKPPGFFAALGNTMSVITGTFGWGSVDVEVGDRKFRFVATHLTPAPPPPPPVPPPTPDQLLLIAIQKAQASELIQSAGGSVLPVVYVGDFNTVRPLPTYGTLVDDSSRIDAWLKKNGLAASCPEPRPAVPDHDRTGCTCCQEPTLNKPTSLDHRVDLVIVPSGTDIAETKLVGANPPTSPQLWPSDHAGVVVSFFPPNP